LELYVDTEGVDMYARDSALLFTWSTNAAVTSEALNTYWPQR